MVSANSDRYKDVQWFGKPYSDITVVGAGGIGSNVAFQLGRLGFTFTIFDNDTVEAVNMSQLFDYGQVGVPKVIAINDTIQKFNPNCRVLSVNEMWTIEQGATEIVFSCVDNMKTRKELFNTWVEQQDTGGNVFIDARLNSEDMRIFVIHGSNYNQIGEYRNKWLFSDEEASEPLCTNKQTPHIGTICGSLMVSLFTNWLCRNDALMRLLPFKVEIHIPTMTFTNEYI